MHLLHLLHLLHSCSVGPTAVSSQHVLLHTPTTHLPGSRIFPLLRQLLLSETSLEKRWVHDACNVKSFGVAGGSGKVRMRMRTTIYDSDKSAPSQLSLRRRIRTPVHCLLCYFPFHSRATGYDSELGDCGLQSACLRLQREGALDWAEMNATKLRQKWLGSRAGSSAKWQPKMRRAVRRGVLPGSAGAPTGHGLSKRRNHGTTFTAHTVHLLVNVQSNSPSHQRASSSAQDGRTYGIIVERREC